MIRVMEDIEMEELCPTRDESAYRTAVGLLCGLGLLTGGLGLAGSFCILTGQPSIVLPPGKWLKPEIHRQMAAPEGATSQFVFSPQGEGVQADWAATAVRQVAANATRHRRNIIFVSRRYAVLLLDYHAREPKFGEEQQLTVLKKDKKFLEISVQMTLDQSWIHMTVEIQS